MSKLKPPVTEKDHVKGELHSPVILLEYGDFQCPHCGAAYPIVKKIEKDYKENLAFAFRHANAFADFRKPAVVRIVNAASVGRVA